MATPKSKTTLHQAHELGQSIWYDNMRRGLSPLGRAARALVDKGVRGLTSNPTIFEKAIVASTDYEDALQQLVAEKQVDAGDLRGARARRHPRRPATCCCRSTSRASGVDGRVSLEVLPELAANTEKTVSEGAAPGASWSGAPTS